MEGVAIQSLCSFYRHSLMLHLIIPTTIRDEGSLLHWEDQRMEACAGRNERESWALGPALPDWLLPPSAGSLLPSACLAFFPWRDKPVNMLGTPDSWLGFDD